MALVFVSPSESDIYMPVDAPLPTPDPVIDLSEFDLLTEEDAMTQGEPVIRLDPFFNWDFDWTLYPVPDLGTNVPDMGNPDNAPPVYTPPDAENAPPIMATRDKLMLLGGGILAYLMLK